MTVSNGFLNLFLVVVFLYEIILTLGILIESEVFRAIASFFAIFLFGFVLFRGFILFGMRPRISGGVRFFGCIYFFGQIVSAFINSDSFQFGEFVKFLMAPLFFVYGAALDYSKFDRVAAEQQAKRFLVASAILGFSVYIVQGAQGALFPGNPVSFFANGNNAGFFWLALGCLYAAIFSKPIRSAGYYLTFNIIFGTLGLSIGVLISLAVSVSRFFEIFLFFVVCVFVAALFYVVPDFFIFDRIHPLLASADLLFSDVYDIGEMSYGDLVSILGTSDLSFLFRVKHWGNLIFIYLDLPLLQMVGGVGLGVSPQYSVIGLLPHNDYIRLLFECGFFSFFGFLGFVVLMSLRLGRGWISVPFFATFIYFCTDNLLNNFISMVVFMFAIGVVYTSRESR
ncbi:hypothetical protein PSQ20_07730 [Curvibacter sp. RS43]|uniref:hypothetical protein n=1 Tax=Curvibacter microcysteis TaxID=3026419 RepID=UPI0023631428|nr:hypothetical protein [Curvibacter sp. RS43]MDD0810219.1 hypothetical protein [Curvibacter sp. RS43]